MLFLISDIHGTARLLRDALLGAPGFFVALSKPDASGLVKSTGPGTLVIQLGDHSFGPEVESHHFFEPWDPGVPVHFLHGNHDYEPALQGHSWPAEIYPHLIFLPDGLVIEHEGRRIGILGGADSVIDLAYRRPGIDHWPSEQVSMEAIRRLIKASEDKPLDLLITHTAPASLIRARLTYPPSKSEELLEEAYQQLGRPPVFCGHIHSAQNYLNITVLPFGESIMIDLQALPSRGD